MGFLTSILVITPFLPPGGPLDPALHPISTCLDSTPFKAGQLVTPPFLVLPRALLVSLSGWLLLGPGVPTMRIHFLFRRAA